MTHKKFSCQIPWAHDLPLKPLDKSWLVGYDLMILEAPAKIYPLELGGFTCLGLCHDCNGIAKSIPFNSIQTSVFDSFLPVKILKPF